MSKIRILPEQLANQIAAGEVVERPASVVKELMENSLDAGADRIEIEIEGGGTRLIRIIDNGEGMDEDDVLLSLERHGTSKIKTDEDLAAISTLGFRGEAIPSIGSVSRMSITSRRPEAELGTRAELNYGKLVKVHEAGCGVGTVMEVRNLFGNTPARRKFLRTVRTELNHIDEVVKSYALAKPEITFALSVNGRRTLLFDAVLSLEQRLAQMMNYSGRFIKVGDEKADFPERRVFGFLVPPEHLRVGPARMRFFVNGRAVKDRMMSHGVAEGLRGFLMKGKNPAGLIHLILPPSEVDVNVHPAKHEVRFRTGRDVHFLIIQAVGSAMREQQQLLQSRIFGGGRASTTVPVERTEQAENPFRPDEHRPDSRALPQNNPTVPSPRPAPGPTRPSQPWLLPAEQVTAPPHPPGSITGMEKPLVTAEPEPVSRPETAGRETVMPRPAPLPAAAKAASVRSHGLQVVGQFQDLYIFCRSSDGLVVIDQHAVHERLLYQELRQQFMNRRVASQQLLFPETVELTLLQAQLVEQHQEELEHMGFGIREFGGSTYIISAVPALVSRLNPAELLSDVLEQFGSESARRDSGDTIDMILATMACRAAVKGGTELSGLEIDSLLARMAEADLFSHCPHGRPVIKLFSMSEIKKWFHRT